MWRQHGWWVAGAAAAVLVLVVGPASGDAQAPSHGPGQGSSPAPLVPRYGPGWAPPSPAPATTPVPRPAWPGPYTRPGPSPPAGPPAPQRWRVPRQDGGEPPSSPPPAPPCDWYLAGTWEADTAPPDAGDAPQLIPPARLTFRQLGSYLVGTGPDERVVYYGYCSRDFVELEVWVGWEVVGHQAGRVAPDGQSITLTWVSWSPDRGEGRATLSGHARRLR